MSIQQRAHRIHHRILLIVTLHQHRVERGDTPIPEVPCPLHQLGQPRKHRRRIPFTRRRLSRCQPNLSCRHRIPRQRVEHQQNMFTPSCVVLRYRGRRHRRTHSQQGALVRGRYQHHRPLASLLAQRVLHKLPHLAPAFPHQPDHRKISRSISCHHPNQRALTHTRTTKDSNSLPTTHRQHSIEHPQPCLQRLFNRLSLHRMRNPCV